MGLILSVANQKGGVGKTTTAVNVAAALALERRRTLLVDCDPQGSASSGVGVQQANPPTIYEVLLGGREIRDALRHTPLAELDLIPSNRDLVGAEVELLELPRREQRLAEALTNLRDSYEFILIDCPPSLGMLTLNALCAADAVLIPLQCEYYALEGLSGLITTLEKVRSAYGRDLRLQGILLTMFDGRTSLCRQVAGEVRSHFGSAVFDSVVPRSVRLGESPSHGLPVLLYDPASKGAEAYRLVAKELLASLGPVGRVGRGEDGGESEKASTR